MKRIESVTKAYHSTRQKGLKKFESRTTIATIDTGEGAHVHGWGLYLQADEMKNRKNYYYGTFAEDVRYAGDDKVVTIGGIKYYMSYCLWDYYENLDKDYCFSKNYGRVTTDNVITLLIQGHSVDDIAKHFSEYTNRNDEETPDYVIELLNEIQKLGYTIEDVDDESVNPPTLSDGTHSYEASQYTVEIPDDMVLIDDHSELNNECFKIALESLFEFAEQYNSKKDYIWDLINKYKQAYRDCLIGKTPNHGLNGWEWYTILTNVLGSQEQASLWLSENGIDGMTYNGGRDDKCWVIYNCDKLKIIGEY